MKRDPITSNPFVKRFWNFFEWNLCDICGKEFRREHGYEMKIGVKLGQFYDYLYVCEDCSPTIIRAEIYRKELICKEKLKKPKHSAPIIPLPRWMNKPKVPKNEIVEEHQTGDWSKGIPFLRENN